MRSFRSRCNSRRNAFSASFDIVSRFGGPARATTVLRISFNKSAGRYVVLVRQEEGTQAGDPVRVAWASDPSRLLPGEVPDTIFLDDADHWVRVYEDLVNWVVGATVKGPLPSEILSDGQEQLDLELLRAHLDRLCERLRFWEVRVKELTAESNKSKSA